MHHGRVQHDDLGVLVAALTGRGLRVGLQVGAGFEIALVVVDLEDVVQLGAVVGVGRVARGLLGRSRPFVTSGSNAYDYSPGKGFAELRYRAYPSIHAASAFATARALTAETARHSRRAAFVVGPIAYSLASLPGLARMYGDKHWASDVFMGAALGAVSGWATVRYHHHRPNNWLDRVFIGGVPTVVADKELGLVWGFKF